MGGWVKNVDNGLLTTKHFQIKLAKTLQNSPNKRNLNQIINDSKPLIWNLSVNLRFSARKSQSQQRRTKKITYIVIQFHSKKRHFMNLNSLNIINIYLQHSQKPYSLYKFSSKHVSVWGQKKHLHRTISRRPKTAFAKQLESKCLCIPVNLCRNIFVLEK